MRFLSTHSWNHTLLFFNTGKFKPKHPKEQRHLTGIEEYVVYNYLLKQGWAFSIQLDLYEKYPDFLAIEGFWEKDKLDLVWIKRIVSKKVTLSSLECKMLLQIAEENNCSRCYFLIRVREIKLVSLFSGKRYKCYWCVLSKLTSF